MIDKSIIDIVKNYSLTLEQNHIPVEKIIIFGSQAKGTAHAYSDIDVCIVSSTFDKDLYEERLKLMKLQTNEAIDIEPHPFTPQDLEDKYNPLANEIRKHGILVK